MAARLLVAATLLLPNGGWAVSVSPARTEVRLPPGGETTAVLTITNPDKVPYNVELSEKPWFNYPNNRQIHVPDWLILPRRTHFQLKAGQSREVKITLRCPKDAVGELMGMVSFAYRGLQPSMITPMISTAVYLVAAGTEKITAEILEVAAESQSGRFGVRAKLQATGNVRLRPVGTIHLLDEKGQRVRDYLVTEGHPIFPGVIQDCVAQGPDAPPPAGRYTLSAELQSGPLVLKADRGLRVSADGKVEMDAVAAPTPPSKETQGL
jgi:hypothetical protein